MQEPSVGWCAVCDRPFEYVTVTPSRGRAILLTRRANTNFCTITGTPVRSSLLDWDGGGPARNTVQRDRGGLLFRDRGRRTVTLKKAWMQSPFERSLGESDQIFALNIVRDTVLATTRAGELAALDLYTGAPLGDVLKWPHHISLREPEQVIHFPPAVRNSRLLIGSQRSLCLAESLPVLQHRSGQMKWCAELQAEAGRVFFGAPLAIPGGFVVVDRPRDSFLGARLRIVDDDLQPQAELPVPDIVRPPVYDPDSRRIFWVNLLGWIQAIPIDPIPEQLPRRDIPSPPKGMLQHLSHSDRPGLVIGPGVDGASALWLAQSDEGHSQLLLYQVGLDKLGRGGTFEWRERLHEHVKGNVKGLTVGLESHHARYSHADTVVVATDMGVYPLSRSLEGVRPRVIEAARFGGTKGSHEPSLLCSAGIITRMHRRLHFRGLEWNEQIETYSDLPGDYPHPSGLAISGRQILTAGELQICAFRLVYSS